MKEKFQNVATVVFLDVVDHWHYNALPAVCASGSGLCTVNGNPVVQKWIIIEQLTALFRRKFFGF